MLGWIQAAMQQNTISVRILNRKADHLHWNSSKLQKLDGFSYSIKIMSPFEHGIIFFSFSTATTTWLFWCPLLFFQPFLSYFWQLAVYVDEK